MKKLPAPPFKNCMTRTQSTLGWIYLPVHILVLPLLLNILNGVMEKPMTGGELNVVYYLFSTAVILAVMLRYLRRSFDTLLDCRRGCMMTVLMMVLSNYAMNLFMSLLLMLLGLLQENAATEMIVAAQGREYAQLMAVGIFLAPIAEEVLFRGVVFGSLRKRSRTLAYIASIVLFSVYHVWQFALRSGEPMYLLAALQYIPISYVLAWGYERSGTIWTTIFFHMGYNAFSFYLLGLL